MNERELDCSRFLFFAPSLLQAIRLTVSRSASLKRPLANQVFFSFSVVNGRFKCLDTLCNLRPRPVVISDHFIFVAVSCSLAYFALFPLSNRRTKRVLSPPKGSFISPSLIKLIKLCNPTGPSHSWQRSSQIEKGLRGLVSLRQEPRRRPRRGQRGLGESEDHPLHVSEVEEEPCGL